ncbi:MAG: WG repeat-containing protein, partial [Alphaproteobacteria bacterium]|nr:WG repeat-containing protein [Alphaproteobacteria bacterium]
RVSTLHIEMLNLAYHSDYQEIAGCWGYINEKGEEVISPQYIYATDFSNGQAIVCKGKWTKDKKWDNDCRKGGYWTDEELWGVIDKDGHEVIPCKYDEIRLLWEYFDGRNDVYQVHVGGWKNGKWGVMDLNGQWLAEPMFDNESYDRHGNLMSFYKYIEEIEDGDDVLYGVYDLKSKKVLFEPQFYDLDFEDNGTLKVKIFDKKQKKKIYKIIDINGKEVFPPQDCSCYYIDNGKYMTVSQYINGKYCSGLLDSKGNVLIPCEYPADFYPKQKLCIYKQNGKAGLKDFDGNIIIKSRYYDIGITNSPFLRIDIAKSKDKPLSGLITKDNKRILPAKYKHIHFVGENKIVAILNNQHTDVFEYIIKK